MPIYEYVCQQCQKPFDLIVRGEVKPTCPFCQSQELVKQFSAFAVGNGQSQTPVEAAACGTCGDPRGPGACRWNN